MELSEKPKDSKIATGIEGLDTLLSGGFPAGRIIIIIGGAGSGKTTLCSQFLHDGITKYNEKGIYISLNYSKQTFLHDMLQFQWNFEELEKSGSFLFLQGSAIRKIQYTSNVGDTRYYPDDLSLEDLIDLITLYVEKTGAKRIVIDDLSALTFRFPGSIQRRAAILTLVESLATINVTTLIISESLVYDINRQISVEEHLADGVIHMFMLKDGSRAIQISKMRGVHVDVKPRPYSIVDNRGIDVFPNETVFS